MRKRANGPGGSPTVPISSPQLSPQPTPVEESEFLNPTKKKSKGGRPARPPRCVVQLRYRVNGKIVNSYSITIDVPFHIAMFAIQETFPKQGKDFRRATDDPRWELHPKVPGAIAATKEVKNG